MRLFNKRGRLLGAAAAMALVLAGCGGGGEEAGGGGDSDIELVASGTLTICTHLPYEPFEFQDDSGEVVGFDVDMLRLLADDLGAEVEVLNTEWDQIISGAVFAAGQCDIGMGAMTITEERAAATTISDPYFDATQALIVMKDSGYKGLEDLEGKILGAQSATTGQIYADDHAEEFGYEVKVFEDVSLQLNALRAGNVDAAINDNVPILNFTKDNPDTVMAAQFDTGEQYGFPVMKDDPNAKKLVDRFNELLAQAKEDGTYDELYEKWFDAKPGETE
ncbi:MAG: transporter substrate-binding domain-containing protein [Propionibacteriaceae bacterium]